MQVDSFLRKVPGVVHVGANSGQERDTYRDFGLRVLWVEAIDEVFDELVKNIAGHPKQKAFCALLTDQDDAEYQFHIASNEGASSSIYQFGECLDIWPELSYLSSRTLRSRRLDSLFRLENISPSDYPALVMDVQGAELLVLKGAGQMLGEFRFIKAEAADFESYVDCAKLDDLRRYLEPLGFKETSRNHFASHPNGGNYWDVVWERPARSILERAKWGLAGITKMRPLSS
jgi:FkbM family methyltransferase